MLKDTLRRFLKTEEPAGVALVLPTGEEINLQSKQSRIFVYKWILKLYDGDDDVADAAACDIIPRAIRKADLPWHYVLKAIYNNALERQKKQIPLDGIPKEIAKLFVSRVSRSRMLLLNKVRLASEVSTVDIEAHQYTLTDNGDRARIGRWLMGHDPFVLFYLLSPQHHGRYMSTNGLQRLVDDVAAIRLRLLEMQDLTEDRAAVNDILTIAIKRCKTRNEINEALRVARSYYANLAHGVLYLVKSPKGRRYKTYGDMQSKISERLKLALYRANDQIRAEWFHAALRLGVIVDPLGWILKTSESNVDFTDDWMDMAWYDETHMKKVHGLRNVGSLFPELVV